MRRIQTQHLKVSKLQSFFSPKIFEESEESYKPTPSEIAAAESKKRRENLLNTARAKVRQDMAH